MYTIILHDGTVLDNLELNGNNFIAPGIIDAAVFDGNLSTVTISDGDRTETYTDMVLRSNRVDGERSWFVLGKKTQQEKLLERLSNMENATDELVLMMADIIGG